MTPQELKNSILQRAIQGKLVEQRPEEGTAEELYQQIQAEKQALIKAGKIKKDKPLPEIAEDEKPFDIPESWKWVRLGNLISIKSGEGLTANQMKVGDVPVYGGNGITGYHNQSIIHEETVVIGRVGFYCGSVHVTEKEAWVTDNAFITTYPQQHIFRDYLVYMLRYMDLGQNNNATAQPVVSGKKIYPLLFPLPPLAEQKRIVAKIEELLPLIDRYDAAWSRLEAFNKRFPGDMQKSLLQMAIQGKLVEQRPEEGTGEELFLQIQAARVEARGPHASTTRGSSKRALPPITDDEKPFDIPESWKWCYVGEVCTNIQYGTSSKSSVSGIVPVLRMGNIQNGRINYEKLVFSSDVNEIEKYHLEYDDLLFNRTNSKELVGKTAIYKAEMPAIYAGYLVRVTPIHMSSDYLNYVMQSQYYWAYCQSVRSDAIGQSNINAEKLKRFFFPLPPLSEQKRIVAKLEELLPLCERLK